MTSQFTAAVRITEPVDDDLTQLVTDGVDVPLRPQQQPQHRIRPAGSGLIGQLSGRLDLQVGQPGDEPSRRPAGLDPGESARERID
ncbi:hypothetical protein [Micromonospora chersina]|uniref:hypothetical protein n=1 Tax=Micromonospora chersina TaxID=47854 RepID=UPI0033E248C1